MPKSKKHFPLFCWQIAVVFIFFWSYPVWSQSHLDSLKTSFAQETNDSLKTIYEIQLVREVHRKNRGKKEHNEEEEYVYANDAIQRALSLKDTLLYAKALDNLGLLFRYHQRYSQAIPLHIKAFKLIEDKEVEPLYKMIFANNAGVAGRYNQNYDLAISYYMKALKMAEKENDLRDIAISSNGIGNALGNIPGREEEALGYFERALKAEKKRDNSLGMAMNYLSISDYYIDKKQFNIARGYLNKLLVINQKRNDLFGLAITYEFYGKSYLEEGKDLQKAASYFENALNRFKDLNNTHKQAELLVSLGEIHLGQDKGQQAKEKFQHSLTLAKKLGHFGLLMKNSFKLADIYEKGNKPLQALKYLKQAEVYEDSMKLAEQNVKITALIRKYNIEKKESHIQLLQKDKALQQTSLKNQQQKLDRRRIFLILMGIGLVFILIVFVLQYRLYRVKKKTNLRIGEKEKEKTKAIYERNLARAEILVTRLRINPHFLFNCLNAIKYLIQSEQNSKAVKYLVVFSRYTRMVLETSQKHVVPLTEELQLTHYYLKLEKNRFEKDFTYQITGDDVPELEKVLIPPMFLQPFIENAIWHGLLPSKRNEKTILLKVTLKGNMVYIIIDDNGVGRKSASSKTSEKSHKSMGMKIIKERIDLYNKSYTGTISFEIIDKKDNEGSAAGTQIVLKLQQEQSFEEKTQL